MTTPAPSLFKHPEAWLKWAYDSWVTRSLVVGACATVLDVCVLLITRKLGMTTRYSAMVGVLFGSTLTFFLNRHFAFRDHDPKLAPQALKFIVATAVCMVIHGYLVQLLTDRWGVPVVISKLLADLVVFTGGQLLVLRYLVFPKARTDDSAHTAHRAAATR